MCLKKKEETLYFPIISPLPCDECPSIEDRRAAISHHRGTLRIYALAQRWPAEILQKEFRFLLEYRH